MDARRVLRAGKGPQDPASSRFQSRRYLDRPMPALSRDETFLDLVLDHYDQLDELMKANGARGRSVSDQPARLLDPERSGAQR